MDPYLATLLTDVVNAQLFAGTISVVVLVSWPWSHHRSCSSLLRLMPQYNFLVCFTISAYKRNNGCRLPFKFSRYASRDVSAVLLGTLLLVMSSYSISACVLVPRFLVLV